MLTSVKDKPVQLFTHATSVESSVIDSLIYDEDSLNLFVKFTNGNVAGYRGVTPAEFVLFSQAESVGRYYNRYIKNQYRGVNSDVNFVPRTGSYATSAAAADNLAASSEAERAADLALAVNEAITVNRPATLAELTEAFEANQPLPTFRVSVVVQADNIAEAIEYVSAAVDGTIESVARA